MGVYTVCGEIERVMRINRRSICANKSLTVMLDDFTPFAPYIPMSGKVQYKTHFITSFRHLLFK